jgi:CRP/FNR family transcriptional regulator, cyclic AMP receptor protein
MISPQLLRRYPCFAEVSEESLKAIAMIAEEKVIPATSQLFSAGDPAHTLSLIENGEVDIQYILGDGDRCTVDTLVEGDILCWSALVEPYKATAIGVTRTAVRLITVNAPKLRELCDKDPLLGYRLMTKVAELLAHRLEGARAQLAAVA